MEQLREDVFQQMFSSGSVRYVDVQLASDGRGLVVYTLQNGTTGVIHTKRGEAKLYRPETALRYLRSIGLVTVKVEMSKWSPAAVQQELQL